MKQLFAIILVLFTKIVLGQTKIEYLTKPGDPSQISLRENYHFRKFKMSDSVWLVKQYDLHDTIMMEGFYKDEALTFPHGKFKYYRYIQPVKEIKYDYLTHKSDTTITKGKNFVETVGYYLNGEKAYTWRYYNLNGKLTLTQDFVHDKLNGPYIKYNPDTDKKMIEGQFNNNVREGNWNMLSFNGDIFQTEVYKKGIIVKTISHLNEKKFEQKMTGGKADYNFISYLNTALSKKRFTNSITTSVAYSFTLDKNGKFKEPSVIHQSQLEIDTAIIEAILLAPAWKPFYINSELSEVSTPLSFDINIFENKRIKITNKELLNNSMADNGYDAARKSFNQIHSDMPVNGRQ